MEGSERREMGGDRKEGRGSKGEEGEMDGGGEGMGY